MHPNAELWPISHLGHFSDRERRRVAGQDRVRLGKLVKQCVELELQLHLFGNGFNQEVSLAANIVDRR